MCFSFTLIPLEELLFLCDQKSNYFPIVQMPAVCIVFPDLVYCFFPAVDSIQYILHYLNLKSEYRRCGLIHYDISYLFKQGGCNQPKVTVQPSIMRKTHTACGRFYSTQYFLNYLNLKFILYLLRLRIPNKYKSSTYE